MMMTAREWNMGIEFLKTAEEGQWVEHNGRRVDVIPMVAGRFVMFEKNMEFCGATDEEWRAMQFLQTGRI